MARMNRIKSLRLKAGITKIEVAAEQYGCSVGFVSMMENGQRQPGRELAKKMCEVLNCTYNDVYGVAKRKKSKKLSTELSLQSS